MLNKEREKVIRNFLNSQNISFDHVRVYKKETEEPGIYVEVQIDNGDWKHEHRRCINALTTNYNLVHIGLHEIDQSDGDTYSAIHKFKVFDMDIEIKEKIMNNSIDDLTIEQIENIILDVIKTTPSRLEAAAHAVKIIANDVIMLTDYCLLTELYDKIASKLGISAIAAEGRIRGFHKDFMNSTSRFDIIMELPLRRATSFIKENELVSLTYYVLSCI